MERLARHKLPQSAKHLPNIEMGCQAPLSFFLSFFRSFVRSFVRSFFSFLFFSCLVRSFLFLAFLSFFLVSSLLTRHTPTSSIGWRMWISLGFGMVPDITCTWLIRTLSCFPRTRSMTIHTTMSTSVLTQGGLPIHVHQLHLYIVWLTNVGNAANTS